MCRALLQAKDLQQSGRQTSFYLHETYSLVIISKYISKIITYGDICCSVARSCLTLSEPMNCITSGFPVLHYIPEFVQTHVFCVDDAIQQSRPLSPTSPFAFNHPTIRVFSNELVLCIRWPKYWRFSFSISPSNEYSGLISFRTD